MLLRHTKGIGLLNVLVKAGQNGQDLGTLINDSLSLSCEDRPETTAVVYFGRTGIEVSGSYAAIYRIMPDCKYVVQLKGSLAADWAESFIAQLMPNMAKDRIAVVVTGGLDGQPVMQYLHSYVTEAGIRVTDVRTKVAIPRQTQQA